MRDNPSRPPERITEAPPIVVDNTPRQVESSQGTPQPTTTTAPEPTSTPNPTSTSQATELKPDQLIINPEVTSLVQDQQAAIEQAVTAARPGARWTQLSTVEPTNEDISNILADNPFAPFALPMGLGLIAAGSVEKVLAFRRQTR